jgi:hypothetical protein
MLCVVAGTPNPSRWRRFLDVLSATRNIAWLFSLFASGGVTTFVLKHLPVGWNEPQSLFAGITVFSGVLFLVVGAVALTRTGWTSLQRRWWPARLEMTLCGGGNTVTLEVRPSRDGDYYGTARYVDALLPPQRAVPLIWHGMSRSAEIRAGDVDFFVLAEVDDPRDTYPRIILTGIGQISTATMRDVEGRVESHWMSIDLEIRCEQLPDIWRKTVRYRFTHEKGLELDLDHPSGTAVV